MAAESSATLTKLPPLLVSEREAAQLLGLSVKTLFNLRRSGQLRGLKIGSRILYDVADLRAFIDRQKAGRP